MVSIIILSIFSIFFDKAFAERLQPEDFQYLGAFRLPGGDERPETFAYGGNAMTFNPDGDPSGSTDGFPESLFITGHGRMPYGELPNGSQFAGISIPVPVKSNNLSDLPQAAFLQSFHDAAQGLFSSLDEIPRIGIQYLNKTATGPRIHIAWGQHFQDDPSTQIPSHAWIDPDLSAPNPQGTWYIANQSLYSVNGYMFEIPASWADVYASGRYLATGRFRDGGWSGKGPALFAYCPWIDESGTPAPSGAHLEETVLLLYESSLNRDDVVERSLNGYQHADEWEGGAWITTTTGKSAVLFAGTKGTGEKYWYGYLNPTNPEYPCVDTEFVEQFIVCRQADGTPCPEEDLTGREGHPDYRGWWSSRFDAQFILYDPADLAQVAAGEMESWEPRPYASIDIDEHLFLNPGRVEEEMLGTGNQRRYRIGAVAYDRSHDLLYVLELFADDAKPVVHVWSVKGEEEEYEYSYYFPHIASRKNGWETEICIINTSTTATINGILKPYNDSGQNVSSNISVTLSPHGRRQISFTIRSLFNEQLPEDIHTAIIKSANGIIALELFGSSEDSGKHYLSGITLKDETTTSMYYPHVASEPWWTGIVAYNPSTSPCEITVTPYTADGTSLATQTRTIEAKGKYFGTIADLNLPENTSWFQIAASTSITGYELFGTNNGNQLGGYTAVNINRNEGMFPKIEKDGWTGIAFVNIENSTAIVTLTAYDDSGSSVAIQSLTV
ncbi:MAG: hypothetical protein DRG25_03650 [Deltaproteobacteria bacterium]|nr:MAG: hypothetical protein DRG25_03650 [Deltaproteobacteria bacterium]